MTLAVTRASTRGSTRWMRTGSRIGPAWITRRVSAPVGRFHGIIAPSITPWGDYVTIMGRYAEGEHGG